MTSISPQPFDLAVLGGGLAGLSLLYHLGKAGKLGDGARVLCVDPAGRKRGYDRTWSFWERENGPFETIVHHRWQSVWVADHDRMLDLDLAPYTYKQIRSSDFYAHVHDYLDGFNNITWLTGRAENVTVSDGQVSFRVGEQGYRSTIAYSSLPLHPRTRPNTAAEKRKAPYLDQHFRGWTIRTERPIFDPARAGLMDFRTPQHGETRFTYLLPTSPTEALVEATVFSNRLLPAEEYEAMMRDYLAEFWTDRYAIEHVEQGVIPMTTHRFPARDRNLIYIGMWAGATRPSTGYTFTSLQRQLATIAAGYPDRLTAPAWRKRDIRYDATLLRILEDGRLPGDDVFVSLFARNPAHRILAFLSGETTLAQELRIMSTTDIGVFGRAFLETAGSI